jgi:hypothetical protein
MTPGTIDPIRWFYSLRGWSHDRRPWRSSGSRSGERGSGHLRLLSCGYLLAALTCSWSPAGLGRLAGRGLGSPGRLGVPGALSCGGRRHRGPSPADRPHVGRWRPPLGAVAALGGALPSDPDRRRRPGALGTILVGGWGWRRSPSGRGHGRQHPAWPASPPSPLARRRNGAAAGRRLGHPAVPDPAAVRASRPGRDQRVAEGAWPVDGEKLTGRQTVTMRARARVDQDQVR